jgi:signal transduction histidine kinase
VPDAADTTVLARVPSRIESTRIADEQAALRCVATLVAQGVSQSELFDAVTAQASRLLAEPMALHRFDPDDHATVVAVHGDPAPFGLRVTTVGDGVAANVRRTGRPSRIDDYERVVGGAAQVAREIGLRGAVGAPIVVAGGVWGAIVAMSSDDPLPPGTEDRLAKFAELVATAIANAEAHAALTASRARVVATADDTRRRIERDLHDGAQQRLVHTVIALKLAKAALGESGGREVELIDQALHNAEQATAELHELVHGIMPAALTRGGLRAAVESLLDHVDLPVDVDISPTRLPAAVETTAYFVVAEALTNAVKHAGATSARVRARDDGDALRLEVRDDGAGGAVPARGTGLVGLTDRVAACGGSIAIASPPGEGTTLTVTLPTGHDPAAGDRRIRATERATGS